MRTLCFAGALLAILIGTGCSTMADPQGPGDQSAQAADANFKLGALYLQRGHYDQALFKLRRALEYAPNRAEVHNALGVLFEQLKNYRESEKHFRLAVEAKSEYWLAQMNYARVLCQLGKHETGEEYFLAVASAPNYDTLETPYTGAGVCANKRGDTRTAKRYFELALESNPLASAALFGLATVNFELKDIQSAQQQLNQYHSLMGHSPPSLELAIKIENALGNIETSERFRQQLENFGRT